MLPGIDHRTLAGREHGLAALSVWSQRMAPGSATPPHVHACEEVVLIVEGEGTLECGGEQRPFRAGDTVIVPAHLAHRLVNTGAEPLRTVAAFNAAPVPVALPDGTPITLPWD